MELTACASIYQNVTIYLARLNVTISIMLKSWLREDEGNNTLARLYIITISKISIMPKSWLREDEGNNTLARLYIITISNQYHA
jgi:hypothetical protein